MSETRQKRILAVDDESDTLEMLENLLNKWGYKATTANSGEAALKLARQEHFDLVLADLMMPGMGGLELLSNLIQIDSSTPVVIITGDMSSETTKQAIWAGAYDYILKPINLESFYHVINRALISRHVFIVHGHDEAAKESVARFLERIKLRPVVLHELPNAGKTIIEKFEQYSNVGFAVVLLTPDDLYSDSASPDQRRYRPRQNVILELGYFLGRLGRDRVCVLYKEQVEIPSDFQGILYIPIDQAGAWRSLLAKELKQAGMDFDLTKAL